MAEQAFDKTKYNSSPTKSTKTPEGAKNPTSGGTPVKGASSRGVEHPIAEDMALIGDTRHELHSKSLPRKSGPNFGAESHAGPDPNMFRVDQGGCADDAL